MSAKPRYPEQIVCRISKEDKDYIYSKDDPSEWMRQAIKEKRLKEQ